MKIVIYSIASQQLAAAIFTSSDGVNLNRSNADIFFFNRLFAQCCDPGINVIFSDELFYAQKNKGDQIINELPF